MTDTSMPLENALALADHASPTPVDAQRALRTLRDRITVLEGASHIATAATVQDGAYRIAAERHRHQSAEGYSTKSDMQYVKHELVDAAIAYAMVAGSGDMDRCRVRAGVQSRSRAWWPWPQHAFKPGADDTSASRIRELEKAGALLAAEIDRLVAIASEESTV